MSKATEALDHCLDQLKATTDYREAEYWATAANKIAGVVESETRLEELKVQIEHVRRQQAQKESV